MTPEPADPRVDAPAAQGCRLSAVVMTHPRRGHLAARLASELSIPGVALDPLPDGPPSPLRTAVRAWAAVEDGATHHAVIQDDISASPALMDILAAAAGRHPHAALAFYANWDSRNGALVRLAALAGANWVRALVNDYTPVVTVLLPAAAAREFSLFARERTVKHDDETMAEFLRQSGIPTYLAAPTPVEHEGDLSISEMNHHGVRRSPCHLPDPRVGTMLGDGATLDVVRCVPYLRYGEANLLVQHERGHDVVPWAEAEGTGLFDKATLELLDEASARPSARQAASWTRVRDRLGSRHTEALRLHSFLTGWFARELADRIGPPAPGPHAELRDVIWERAASTIGIASVNGDERAALRPDLVEALRRCSVQQVRAGWSFRAPGAGTTRSGGPACF